MSNFREVVGFQAFFGSSKKFQTLRTQTYHIIYHFEAGDLEIPNIWFVSRKIQISRFHESI